MEHNKQDVFLYYASSWKMALFMPFTVRAEQKTKQAVWIFETSA